MILLAFAIRDNKAEAFNTPFFAPTRGLAVRSFQEAVNDPASPFAKYPDDFTLFQVGSFDDNTGRLSAEDIPAVVISAIELQTEIKS